MGRRLISGKIEVREAQKVVPVSKGGTGVTTLSQLKQVLGVVDRDTIGQVGGAIPLDSSGKINSSYIDVESIANWPTLKYVSGYTEGLIALNNPIVYTITNHENGKTYEITNTLNCTVTVKGATLTFTASNVNPSFTINGRTIKLTAVQPKIKQAVIVSPLVGSLIDFSRVTIATSEFKAIGSASELHVASYYKICSDSAGKNVLWGSGRDTSNLLSIDATLTNPLPYGTTVYIFARHEGSNLGVGEWSEPVSCVTASLGKPSITNPINNANLSTDVVTVTSSSFVTNGTTTHAASDWKVFNVDTEEELANSLDDRFNLTSWAIANLPVNTSLKVQVRYKDNTGAYTDWSDAVAFSIISSISRPSIISPTNGATITTGMPSLSASAFASTGNLLTHESSSWVISKDNAFTQVVARVDRSTVYKTTYSPTNLPTFTTLYARVRYHSTTGESSGWSDIISFTINVSIDKPNILSPGNNTDVTLKSVDSIKLTFSEFKLNQ